MELTTTIKEVLEQKTGTSNGKDWCSQSIILNTDTETKYPKILCVSFFGDKFTEPISKLKEGSIVTVKFSVESREYKGNYFTEARGWYITSGNAEAPKAESQGSIEMPINEPEDDLPF